MRIFDNFSPVLRDLKHSFDFLFVHGFNICFSDFRGRGMLGWDIILKSPVCLVRIFKVRSEIFLVLAPLNSLLNNNEIDIDSQIGIKAAIYFASHKEKFVGLFDEVVYKSRKKQLDSLAHLLEESFDEVTPYFEESVFQNYKSGLLNAQKEYNNLLTQKFIFKM